MMFAISTAYRDNCRSFIDHIYAMNTKNVTSSRLRAYAALKDGVASLTEENQVMALAVEQRRDPPLCYSIPWPAAALYNFCWFTVISI